jgi:hypothetical protein
MSGGRFIPKILAIGMGVLASSAVVARAVRLHTSVRFPLLFDRTCAVWWVIAGRALTLKPLPGRAAPYRCRGSGKVISCKLQRRDAFLIFAPQSLYVRFAFCQHP